MRKTDFRVEPFVNMFGQTLNPGDDVIYVGKSCQNIVFGKGKYAGAYYGWYSWGREDKGLSAIRVDGISSKRLQYDKTNRNHYYKNVLRSAVLPQKRVFRLDTPIDVDFLNKLF